MPGSAESVDWSFTPDVFIRDLSEDALFQNFNEENAATLYAGEPPPTITTEPSVSPDATEQIFVPSASSSEIHAAPLSDSFEDAAELEEVGSSDDEEGSDESLPESAPEPEATHESVSHSFIRDGVFGLFKTVTGLFSFVEMSTTTQTNPESDSSSGSSLDTDTAAPLFLPVNEIPPNDSNADEETQNSEIQVTVTHGEAEVDSSESSIVSVPPPESNEEGREVAPYVDVSSVTQDSDNQREEFRESSMPSDSIEFHDFGLGPLNSGQFVTNIQLRVSLAAQYDLRATSAEPGQIDIEYTFDNEWHNAGTIALDGETSNALNGGYFLFALPHIEDTHELNELRARVTFHGDGNRVRGLYLDALWLEVDTETFDRAVFAERLHPHNLDFLRLPMLSALMSDTLDFKRSEYPTFTLRYESQRNFAIRFFRELLGRDLAEVNAIVFRHRDLGLIDLRPKLDVTAEGLITIQVSEADLEKMRPGEYTLELEIDEGGKILKDSFNFQWGLLAVNPDKTEYAVGDRAHIALGALTQNGNTLCSADLMLYVIDPRGFISRAPVERSGLCTGNNVVDVPDYSAFFSPTLPGTYELYVERVDADGNVMAHTSDTFNVVESHPFSLTRDGPTRIFPPAVYPMSITLSATEPISGTFTETLPPDFTVEDTDGELFILNGRQELTWTFDLSAGETKIFTYSFDAPDLSPYLYTLGPARIELINPIVLTMDTSNSHNTDGRGPQNGNGNPASTFGSTSPSSPVAVEEDIASKKPDAPESLGNASGRQETPQSTTQFVDGFEEHRKWQIASDATGNMILYWDDGATIPSGWSCLSCGSGTFYQRFAMGGSTYNTTGGATTHTHNASTSLNASADATVENFSGTTVDVVSHSHTLTPSIATASNLPAYRQLRVIQYTASAGEPPSIPAGVIGIFEVASSSLPAGWPRYALHDGRYVYGENTPGTTGGANTHTHSISGTTGGGTGSTYGNRGGGTPANAAAAGHTHTISTSTVSVSSEPPYVEVLLAKLATATTTLPNGIVAMWTDEVPAGWIDVSSAPSSAYNGKFIKATSTYGATGGASTHAHSDMPNITTSGPSGTAVVGRASTPAFGASFTHTHAVSMTNFTTESMLPPYLTVIYGKRQGNVPVINQWSYRWYVNGVSSTTPTDAWPQGALELTEKESITATSTPVKNGQVLRLRLSALVTNATATVGTTVKLQYAAGTVCSAATGWADVGSATSSVIWRGYNNSGVTDHVTLPTALLASTTVNETYEENGYATGTPNELGVNAVGEWDFVLQHNGAASSTVYCFRLVQTDGTLLSSYTTYPQLLTNRAPDAPTLSRLFDNEKVASTSPWFEFVTSDPESDELTYEIQVDDDYGFTSTVIDKDSTTFDTQFENLVTPADKDPFTSGQLIRFKSNTTLTNGTTYYWRVRAKDTNGSGFYGDWSDIRSFTIDTSLTVSAWFQTREEQFDTDSLSGVDAIVSDAVQLITGSTTGSIISTPITFSSGSFGTAWDSLEFSDSKTGGTLKYQIEYLNTVSGWNLIPDTALAGNSAGFTSSPVSLLDLDTSTYASIRLVAYFTYATGSPTLYDWTVNWGYRVETPTITKLFPNERVGTTTPVFQFKTTDPQSDSLTYQISWSTDITFTSSTTRTSDTHSGFVNAVSGGDLDPFNSGDTIRFTIQPGDALNDSTTYWWRVRAKDTTGDNVYSFWTEPRSFTVSSTTVVSTWYQTTEEQFNTNILSGTRALATDAVSVATTATEAMLVYGEGVQTSPRYRQWNGSEWGSEGQLNSIGAPVKWAIVKAGTTREEYVAGTIGTDGDVNLQVYSTGAWGNLQEVTTNVGDISSRGFDIAYETLSGRGIVVFCDGDADPSYYIWNGTAWASGTSTINLASASNCEWIKLASDPTSNEIIVLAGDASGGQFEAQVWDGSTWGNSTTQGSLTDPDNEGLAVAYEESGNQAIIITSDGNPARFRYNTWNGSTWGTAATVSLGNDFEWGTLVSDVGSDALALCYVDDDANIGTIEWSGSAWGAFTSLGAGITKSQPSVACAYENTTSRDNYIMTTYSTSTGVGYRFWNNSAWSTVATVRSITQSQTMELERTGTNALLGLFFNTASDQLLASSWDGSSWATSTTIETNASVDTSPYGRPYDIAPRNSGKRGTVIVSPAIDFNEGVAPYWQQMYWTDSTPGTSDILYSVQYYDTASSSWKFVPDSAIPGNSVGTTSGPINLAGLNVSTYRYLRPYALLICDASNNCPTLSDWTVEWSAGITASGTAQQYDQSTNVTSGTVGVAVNGVLQTGKTGTISGGTWSINNVTAFVGDIITVFVTGADEANEAIAVTRYDGTGDVGGLRLYERHLTLGSNDATTTPLTNADIGGYDYTNSEDLFFDVNGSTLTVCADTGCGDAELYIGSGVTYQPGGRVVTHDIEINGTFSRGGNSIHVGGSWDNNGTTTAATSTVVFTATSSIEIIDETGAVSPSFYNLTFGTTTGAAIWNLVTPLDVNNDLTLTRGTLNRGQLLITVGRSLTNAANGFWQGVGTTTFDGTAAANWSDSNSTLQNVGRVVIDGTSKTVTLAGNVLAQTVAIGTDDILDASALNHNVTVYSGWTNSNTFVSRSGTVFFAATTTNHIITVGNSAFYNLTFSGAGGTWSFSGANLNVTNDLTIATGTVTLPTGTTTLSGSFVNSGGTFLHNNATVLMNTSGAEILTLSGTAFTNAFFNLRFSGSGSWSFTEADATTTNALLITQGSVTFPSGTLSVGGDFANTGGSFAHNSGTVRMTASGARTIDTNASFNSLAFTGSGSWSFIDANVTALGNLSVSNGTVTLPSGTLSLGGSLTNSAALVHNSGTVLMNSTDTGEIVNLGNSSLATLVFRSATGGWTIVAPATTTNDFTLASSSAFTLSSGHSLSVGGTFTNSVGGASTTWTGSTLSLEAGAYTLNSKTLGADTYSTLAVKANTDIKMWNSSATTYLIDSTGSLYSQDHAGVDGDLYLFGSYERTSGTEHWSYGTDFDGTTLSATTSRQVDVRFASDASATFTNATMSIIGTSTASTTIANQGSGTYTVSVSGGTTTASYYDFNDLGASGLSLAGGTYVSTLSNGRFVPSVAAGTGITISSSTIDANPGLQIFTVEFSTTTAIAATNVSQTDGAPASYWWFRESTGNIDGEYFDNDTGDPGSIRWDDSSLSITVEGTVYESDGSTPLGAPTCGAGSPVRVVVENGGVHDGACDGSGAFSIPNVVIVGDPTITVFLNGASGGERGVTITKTPTTNITGLSLIANRVVVRHEDVAALTIEDMDAFDNGYDADIPFLTSTGTLHELTVEPDFGLTVAAGKSFAPGGTVSLQSGGTGSAYDGSLYLMPSSTFTAVGTSTYSIGGSFFAYASSTFTPASSTVHMTATTSGKTITSSTSESIALHNLSFTGVGGGWNLNGNLALQGELDLATGTLTGTGNITLQNGSFSGNGLLSLGSGTTTLAISNTLGGPQAWTFANLVLGNGNTTGTTSKATIATTTVLGKLTVSIGHYFKAYGSLLNLEGSGTVFVENGTFIEGTSTVRYGGTSGSSVISTTYHNLVINGTGSTQTYTATGIGIIVVNDLVVGGSATTTFTLDTNDPALDVNGNVYIAPRATFVGSGSGSMTVAGSWDNDGTFTGSGGTVVFDGGGVQTIAAGSSSFSSLRASSTGSLSITEHATTTGTFTLAATGNFTLGSARSLAVGGTFMNGVDGALTDWTGSTLFLYGGGNYTTNASTTSDDYETVRIGANTDIRMWNSSAVAFDVDGSSSLYSQDHNDIDGFLYIFGDYVKTSGTDYWSYARDFDGTALSGGDERSVTVFIAENSSTTFLGGGLQVLGTPGASTTIRNQGTGTYSIRIGGTASTTWSYYQVYDTDVRGLTFSGTPNVVTLSYGDYFVTTASGTAITVGGTVITQNPAKTFTQNSFATSSAIVARNVTATGTTASSWRFTNHTGNIDGEDFDSDPTGDPGYIVWDDSAALLTFSGHVYTNEGSGVSGVCDGTPRLTLRVAGLTSYTASCAPGDGLYTISNVSYSPGDSFVVYIDGQSEKGATVSEDPVTNISDLDIYENRVIVRHEGADPLSISDMAVWDSSDDGDIPFTAIDAGTDTLTLPADRKLIIWNTKTFAPTGNMTLSGGGGGGAHDGTLELYANAIFDATGAESHSIGGSLILGSGATIDDETSTFTFTTSGAARTIDTNDQSFYNLTFNGSGSWTISNSLLDIGNDLTITQGTVTLPTGTTTIAGSFLNTGGSFSQNGGWVRFTSTAAETIRMGGGTFGTTTFTGSGSWTYHGGFATTTGDFIILSGTVSAPTGTLTIGGDFENNATYTHNSGTIRMTSSLSSTTINASTSDLGSVTIAGGGSFTFTDASVALAGSLTLLSGTTSLPTTTIAIGGSLISQGGSFIHGSGTVLFNSGDTGESITPGSSTFANISIAAPSGSYTLTGSATTTGNFSLTSATSFTASPGVTLTVGGVFTNLVGGGATTWTGSIVRLMGGVPYVINTKVAGADVYDLMHIGSNSDVSMWNSSATTTMLDTLSSLYSMDNANVNGELYIYGDYRRTTGADYWSYATDFDGTSLSGSERVVNVRHQSGATSTFSGGTLQILGGVGATTTITNQGSGTYAMRVSGGTLYALNYAFRNLGANGLELSGTTTVTSISNGDFELAISGGTLITLSSTTLNYNASMVSSGMRFATTSAITGVNVDLVGTTPSFWTFTSHRGNLAGEYFDVDGGGDCGSLRWDDSTCLITQQSAYRWRNDDGGEGVPDSEWFDTNWTKRRRVSITNDDATTYTNAAVKLTISYDGDMQSDFDDLRFTSSDGLTPLSFVREIYTTSATATVWVKVPSLAASADTDIYMYYGNGGAANGGVGTSTFIAYDDFEDGGITEYSNDTAQFTVDGSFAYQGAYGLEATDPNDVTTDGIHRTDMTVSQGETMRFLQYVDTSGAGASDETCALFGVQTPTAANNNYAVCLEQYGTDRVSIAKNVTSRDTSGTVLASTSMSYVTGWYEVEVDWNTNDTIFVSVYQDGSLVATTSATDSSYTTGGIGFSYWGQHGGWDIYSSRPLLATDPMTAFGSEQVRGGASWIAALNTKASTVTVGSTIRSRFVIENTGLSISDAYRLEYASKGVAPSCESVSAAAYSAVPVQASCSGSPLCMESSTHFTNQSPTTDILGGEGAFTPGEIIEDPSNTTQTLSIDSNEYTEVEFAITVTNDISDSNYCLRVTDNGSDLDSYTRVAEMQIIFAPNITALSLNSGLDISLLPGVTTTIYATGTVSDFNGYSDLQSATATIFRSGVSAGCTLDENNCYQTSTEGQCSFTDCAGDTCNIQCAVDLYYFAEPTDIGTYAGDSWIVTLSASDQGGYTDNATGTPVDLTTLRAVTVDNSIDYGALEVNTDTGSYNATTTLENIGNTSVDLSIEGTDLTDGQTSVIPVNEQKFATSSFTYSACVVCTQLSMSATNYELDLTKPTSTTPSVTDELFWGIAVPYGVAGRPHRGDVTFYPISD